ncbi:VirK family virulence factor [Buttiauxella ferragutiae ATCC 51602]|uniref:VirK family virulence factor n=2 Tax=Buttiauxella ferragutiae TaxID=82989 RepID=A0ABX2W3J5_9ENTR|nr:VirK family virulence factor [Buttiauxella ferragutiae ATCC 51602]
MFLNQVSIMSSIAENEFRSTAQLNGWRLFLSLAKGQWTPGIAWQNPAYRRKFVLRSLTSPLSTARLLNDLSHQPLLEKLLAVQPGLPCRLHRPYLSVNFNRKAAASALSFHYRVLNAALPKRLLLQHYSTDGARLATITGKDENFYHLDFRADPFVDKEGEATLTLTRHDGVVLAGLTFTLCCHQQKSTLFIGGLQGAKSDIPHEYIQVATKACHGLFPKRLVLEAACLLARHLGVNQILAVSNRAHIYHSWRYAKKKQDKIHADYDSFWESMSGELTPEGYFELPLGVARKPVEEIASKKRAEYRRRYSLLDEMMEQIEQRL